MHSGGALRCGLRVAVAAAAACWMRIAVAFLSSVDVGGVYVVFVVLCCCVLVAGGPFMVSRKLAMKDDSNMSSRCS